MLKLRSIFALAAAVIAVSLAPSAAMAAVTADIGGVEAGGPENGGMTWDLSYDDVTRAVTATADGTGWCFVTVQLTNTITRTVAFYPGALTATSQNPDLAARMVAADFRVIADGSVTTLASGVAPAAVKRILGKANATIGGFNSASEWSRF